MNRKVGRPSSTPAKRNIPPLSTPKSLRSSAEPYNKLLCYMPKEKEWC